MSASPSDRILISPLWEPDSRLADRLRKEISRVFVCPAEFYPILRDIEFALDRTRFQYHSTAILEKLADAAPPMP